MIILLLSFELAFSLINSGRTNLVRFALVIGINSFIAYFTITEKSLVTYIYPSGEKSYILTGNLRFMVLLATSYVTLLYLFYAWRIYRNSYDELRKYAFYNLIGTSIFGPASTLVFLLKWNKIIPGIVELLIGVGLLVSSYALMRKPELFHLLPFQAIKLFVIERYSGNILFTYNWEDEFDDIPNQLISSALESISQFVNETIQRGDLESIKLSDAYITVKDMRELNVYFVLISTKPSYVLYSGLELFSIYFKNEYQDLILPTNGIQETTKFSKADTFISKSFPFVPKSQLLN
jgi:hypothetical protein